jgi:hypothetical protein
MSPTAGRRVVLFTAEEISLWDTNALFVKEGTVNLRATGPKKAKCQGTSLVPWQNHDRSAVRGGRLEWVK